MASIKEIVSCLYTLRFEEKDAKFIIKALHYVTCSIKERLHIRFPHAFSALRCDFYYLP